MLTFRQTKGIQVAVGLFLHSSVWSLGVKLELQEADKRTSC